MSFKSFLSFTQDVGLYKVIHTLLGVFCLSTCLYPINVKTAEPIRPKLSGDLTWIIMDRQNFKYLL